MDNVTQMIQESRRAPKVFTCSNGVVLQIRPVPSHVTREILRTIKEPRVPVFHNDAKERDEENPNDPAYLEALAEFKDKQVDLTNRAYLMHTSVLTIPEGIETYDGTTWSEFQEELGISVHAGGRDRYIDWLKFHVLTDADFRDLMTAIYVAGGLVSEEDVKSAIENFPNNTNGSADTNVSPQ